MPSYFKKEEPGYSHNLNQVKSTCNSGNNSMSGIHSCSSGIVQRPWVTSTAAPSVAHMACFLGSSWLRCCSWWSPHGSVITKSTRVVCYNRLQFYQWPLLGPSWDSRPATHWQFSSALHDLLLIQSQYNLFDPYTTKFGC